MHEPPEEQSIEKFLHDRNIGALSGLAKRFADLELFDEPRTLTANVQSEIYLGMAFCAYMRGDIKSITHIIDASHGLIKPGTIILLEEVIAVSDLAKDHRFEVLLYDYKALRETEKRLKSDLVIEQNMGKLDVAILGQQAEQHSRKMALHEYHTLSHLFGITLAEGRLNDASAYAQRLNALPNLDEYDVHGHTKTVVQYFLDGGKKRLQHAAAFRYGSNPCWWNDRFSKHGRYKRMLDSCREDIFTNPITTAFYATLGATAYWLVSRIVPDLVQAIEHIGSK